jgi:hypothetical protein
MRGIAMVERVSRAEEQKQALILAQGSPQGEAATNRTPSTVATAVTGEDSAPVALFGIPTKRSTGAPAVVDGNIATLAAKKRAHVLESPSCTHHSTHYPVGTKVRKFFEGHGWFSGEIVLVEDDRCKVVYDDGDEEEYLFESECDQLDHIVANAGTTQHKDDGAKRHTTGVAAVGAVNNAAVAGTGTTGTNAGDEVYADAVEALISLKVVPTPTKRLAVAKTPAVAKMPASTKKTPAASQKTRITSEQSGTTPLRKQKGRKSKTNNAVVPTHSETDTE